MTGDIPQPGVVEGQLLWTPPPERIAAARLTRFRAWLHETQGLTFTSVQGGVLARGRRLVEGSAGVV